ncbi:hypothetical protein [Sorangium sp. So ce1335]|uniref:hypothetical protein n=1 Tax=Sorangium sp. So ce1335 TaxID=3133335 RepID=UPI003F62AF3F
MTGRLRGVLGVGCAAAAALTAGRAAAMQQPPPRPPAPAASPASSAPPGHPGGAAAVQPPGDAASQPASPAPPPGGAASPPPPPAPPPGGAASQPASPAPPPGDAASPPPPPEPPAGAWSGTPPGYPPPPPGWMWSPVPVPPEGIPGGAQPAPRRVWYGWQHLLVGLGSLVLLPVGAAAESEALVLLSVGGFAFGGPVTHWANGNVGKGFISLGLNAGGTIGGGLVGMVLAASSDSYDEPFAALGGFLIGGGLGLLTANIIDIASLEYEERWPTGERYDYLRLRSPRLRLAPQAALAPGGATFGLGGTF